MEISIERLFQLYGELAVQKVLLEEEIARLRALLEEAKELGNEASARAPTGKD